MMHDIILPVLQSIIRIRIALRGIVQGVGFRPFALKCAKGRGLVGFVENTSEGVIIEAQGNESDLRDFVNFILSNHPPTALISDVKIKEMSLANDTDFIISESNQSHNKEPAFPPDLSVCDDCLKELFDPSNRRYRYPFINCTNCGPRFTIIKGLPYDRPLTSMAVFEMCHDCMSEYNDHLDRRFHAEPNACPVCGPKVFWAKPDGSVIAEGDDAFKLCEEIIQNGDIAAVKGIGGFHLMANALNDEAVGLLRKRKSRYEKPFAVIFPLDKREALLYLRGEAFIDAEEEKAILSSGRPIVILRKRADSKLSKLISPGLDTVGAFLPYSPLHYLLLNDLKMPLIATSANFSDTPIIKDNKEVIGKLEGIVDGFLLHNRDIVRRCDDSVISIYGGKRMFFRRSRGYTPQTFKLPYKLNEPILAVGGNQKVTIAVGWEDKAVVSQHLGDLTSEEGMHAFEDTVLDLTDFYNITPLRIAVDMHPDYLSTKWAASQRNVKHIQVQHHHAHIAACMLDNNLTDKLLGISWDGSGYGPDGTIWGGEFLIADYKNFERFCTFRKFRLLGGEEAIKEPRRALLSMFYEIYGEDVLKQHPKLKALFTKKELALFLQMLKKGFHSPFTTSAGRVFDVVSSLLGICHKATYEGQGAIMLEDRAEGRTGTSYPIIVESVVADSSALLNTPINGRLQTYSGYVFEWAPMLKAMIEDMLRGLGVKMISLNLHETLAQLIVQIARMARNGRGLNTICLSGGVFQNKVLTERAINLLKENGFNVYTHNTIPPNDGGISIGQLIIGGTALF
ncbi:MAG: carbamoyltransferase HypF [Deltaproteobacteria bacterium]|nr:carbamoyltransferase HypF [Deltaproteobacteria bacterium]